MIFSLLKKITTGLEERNIPYMLSGSLALNSYSIPRMTLDIDIVIELKEEDLPGFLSLFSNGYYIHEGSVRTETARKGMFNIIDNKTGLKVDFIIKKHTEYRLHEFNRRVKKNIGDIEAFIVSPEDLIISKLEWIQVLYSDRQISDIKSLLALPYIDIDYLKEWCNKLKLNTFELL